MDANTQVQIFKQETVRWLNTQIDVLLGDGFGGKLIRPVIEEMIDKYSQDKGIDAFLSIFVNGQGKFDIDNLLDKYIDIFTEDGGIRFKWGDITPMGSLLDRMLGNKTNVITADDVKNLKIAVKKALGE